jgi:hypothetical protein
VLGNLLKTPFTKLHPPTVQRFQKCGVGPKKEQFSPWVDRPIVNSVALIEVHGQRAELRIADPIEKGHIQQTIAVKVSHRE